MSQKSSQKNYIPPYNKKQIEARFLALVQECKFYLDALNTINSTWDLRFDPFVLLSVAKSSLDDIWRYKSYHLRDPKTLSDSIKRAAYFTKWIVKSRPIYFNRTSSNDAISNQTFDQDGKTLLINETFAIVFSLITISTEIKVEKINLDEEFFANLVYDLHYRNISSDALLSIYEIIRNAARDKSIIKHVLR